MTTSCLKRQEVSGVVSPPDNSIYGYLHCKSGGELQIDPWVAPQSYRVCTPLSYTHTYTHAHTAAKWC